MPTERAKRRAGKKAVIPGRVSEKSKSAGGSESNSVAEVIERSTTSAELQHTRAFQKWMREFSAAAVEDDYAELLRPLQHLGLKCSGKNALTSTISLVLAVVVYCEMDGRDCKAFLKRQKYRLKRGPDVEYCLTFNLSGPRASHFARIASNSQLASIDLEDLFNHMWPMSKTAGFSEVYISRIDGKRIDEQELWSLEERVTSDMFYGYSEEELCVEVFMSDFPDTAMIYAVERDDELC